MATKYNSLEELRRKKELLKKDVSEMEDLITFDNAKESLSALTNGFTDKFIKEVPDDHGGTKIALNKDGIIQEVRTEVKEKVFSKRAVLGFAESAGRNGLFEDALKLGATAFVGNFARKSMKDSNWKKKLIVLALIYLAPIALRFIRKKLEQYQKNRSVSSMEQLI